jgi:hypothetical protein
VTPYQESKTMSRSTTRWLLSLLALALAMTPLRAMAQAANPEIPAASLYGDVNGDGKVTVLDAMAVLAYVTGKSLPAEYHVLPNADANGDGRVTAMDALVVAASAMGRDMSRFPVGQDVNGAVLPPAEGTSGAAALAGYTVTVNSGNNQVGWAADSLRTAIQAIVKNGSGNPVGTVTVYWSIQAGGGSVRAATSNSGATGIATNKWLVGTAGAGTLRATIKDGAGGVVSSVDFSATAIDPATATITVSSGDNQTGVTGDTLARPLIALVKDGSNNPIVGPTVAWTVLAGGGSTFPAATPSGPARSTLSATGSASMRWVVGGSNPQTLKAEIPGGASVNFTANGQSGANVVLTKVADNLYGIVADSLGLGGWLEVTDGSSNPISTYVNWSAQDGGAVSPARSATNSTQGRATTKWLLGAGVGAQHIVGKVDGVADSAVFTANAVAVDSVVLAKNGDNQRAEGGTALSVSVDVTDNHSNPISGWVAYAPLTGGSPTAAGRVVTFSQVTGAVNPGRAPMTWTLGSARGFQTFQASVAGGQKTATFTALSTLLAGDQLTQNGGSGSGTAGSNVATAPSVLVADNLSNPVANYPVVFRVSAGGGSIDGAATADSVIVNTNGSGIASLTTWTLGTTAGANTVHVTAGAKSLNINATGVAGAAASVVMVTQPAGASNGSDFGTQPVLQVVDQYGNAVSGAGVSVTAAITSGSGTLGGTTTVISDANGVITFTNLSITGTSGSFTLGFSSAGLTGASSSSFSVATGSASKLAFTAQPSNAAAGASLGTITVTVQDVGGNTVTGSSASITLAIGTNPGGGTLSGTATVAASSGVATFTGMSINKVGTGYTLGASSAGLTGATSGTFNITAATASQIVLVTAPAGASSGSAFGTQPVLQLQDAFGNPVSQAGVSVTAAITSGSGTLGGTVTVQSDANGTVTFTNLSISGTAGSFTLGFTSGGLTAASSGSFSVGAGAASKLAFTAQPSNAVAGTTLGTVTVTVQDASNNTVTGSSASITLAIGTNPGAGTLSGTATVAASSGVATFTGLSINKAGTGYTLGASSAGLTGATSGTFNITPAAASQIVLVTAPAGASSGSAFSTQPVLQLKDAFGNSVSQAGVSVTAAITAGAGGTLGGTTSVASDANGTITFTNLSITGTAGSFTLGFTSGGLTAASSGSFNVGAGAASKLAFTAQPSNAVAGTTLGTITVTVQDASNNTVTGSSASITLAIGTNPGAGTLSGTATVAASSGVATFTGLNINKTGTGYTLSAAATGLTGATSGTFNITPGAAATAVFNQQPTNAVSGVSISPAITVTVRDANSNLVANGTSVSMAILNNAGSPAGTLSGTTSVTTTSGVATFSNLSIDKAGVGYTIRATSGAAGVTSSAFNITNAAATTITALTATNQTTPVGAGCKNSFLTGPCAMPLPSVKVTDANGNAVAGVTVRFTLTTAISGNKGEFTVNAVQLTTTGSFTDVVTDATGTISATSWKSAQSNGANTVTAAATGLTNSPITFTINTVN